MVSLHFLPALLAVAETRSLTEASRRLGLTQPAVHSQLKKLASEAGGSLYRRSARGGLELTARGRRLVRLGIEVQEAVRRYRNDPEPDVVLAAGRGVWTSILATRLLGCEVPPTPMIATSEEAVDAVKTGRAQLGVCAGPAPSDLDHQHLVTVGQKLIANAPVRPEERLEHTWLLPASGSPHRSSTLAWLGASPARIVEVQGWEVMIALASIGAGICLINDNIPLPEPLWSQSVEAHRIRFQLIWLPEERARIKPLVRALASPDARTPRDGDP